MRVIIVVRFIVITIVVIVIVIIIIMIMIIIIIVKFRFYQGVTTKILADLDWCKLFQNYIKLDVALFYLHNLFRCSHLCNYTCSQ